MGFLLPNAFRWSFIWFAYRIFEIHAVSWKLEFYSWSVPTINPGQRELSDLYLFLKRALCITNTETQRFKDLKPLLSCKIYFFFQVQTPIEQMKSGRDSEVRLWASTRMKENITASVLGSKGCWGSLGSLGSCTDALCTAQKGLFWDASGNPESRNWGLQGKLGSVGRQGSGRPSFCPPSGLLGAGRAL